MNPDDAPLQATDWAESRRTVVQPSCAVAAAWLTKQTDANGTEEDEELDA